MTRIRLPYVHEYRDRHGKLRRYVRRPGSRRVALPGLPGSPEFMQAYQDAMSGPALRPRAAKAGTLAALAAEFFASTEFANLKPSSQATYRMVLAPVLGLDGHRLVRDLPSDKARKIIQEIGANRPALDQSDEVHSPPRLLIRHRHRAAPRQSVRHHPSVQDWHASHLERRPAGRLREALAPRRPRTSRL